MNVSIRVDQFAQHVNAARLPVIGWIEELEGRMGHRFPLSFRSFIGRYEFHPFDYKGVYFFGNTREPHEEATELRLAIFRDAILSQCLLANGYIQFGRPDTGDYDPICFDINQKKSNREHPIVRIDHESVLCFSRIRIREVIAPSFYDFILTT